MRIKLIYVISTILMFYSCKNSFFSGKIDEGTIQYDIVYLDDSKSNPLISLLPTELTLKFKKNNYITKIEGWMGIFSMAGIYNVTKKTNSALLKIMNEKYHYETDLNGPSFGFDSMPVFKIVETKEAKVIANYNCKKVLIKFDDNSVWKDFEIYYTDEIDLENPNKNNPFSEIKGVILDYRMSFQKIKMSLIATKVESVEVPDEEFDIPAGYSKVPKEKMEEVIGNLM